MIGQFYGLAAAVHGAHHLGHFSERPLPQDLLGHTGPRGRLRHVETLGRGFCPEGRISQHPLPPTRAYAMREFNTTAELLGRQKCPRSPRVHRLTPPVKSLQTMHRRHTNQQYCCCDAMIAEIRVKTAETRLAQKFPGHSPYVAQKHGIILKVLLHLSEAAWARDERGCKRVVCRTRTITYPTAVLYHSLLITATAPDITVYQYGAQPTAYVCIWLRDTSRLTPCRILCSDPITTAGMLGIFFSGEQLKKRYRYSCAGRELFSPASS